MNKTDFIVIDLFSGCGGSAMGFQQAGFEIKVAVDNNKTATDSFKMNFPECVVYLTDITSLSGKELLKAVGVKNGSKVVVIACPPCQGFSTARRRSERSNDPRNLLIFQFLKIIEEVKPVGFVMENVPGMAIGPGKTDYLTVLQKLHDLKYNTAERIVLASDYGVPQKRRRLIVIGVKSLGKKPEFPENTHSDNEEDGLLPLVTVRNVVRDLPAINAGEKYFNDPMHVAARVSETNLERLRRTPHDGGSRSSWPDELVLECHKKASGHNDVYGRMKWDFPSPTITGGCGMITKGRFGHPEQNRAISLREAARLQTFPDSFLFAGNFGDIAKQIGNAVPPLLAKRTAEALLNAIDKGKIH